MSLTVVNAALEAKAKAWTFKAKAEAWTFEAKAWPDLRGHGQGLTFEATAKAKAWTFEAKAWTFEAKAKA